MIKKAITLLFVAVIFWQCAENEHPKSTDKIGSSTPTIVSENLEPYQLTAKDTVYSVDLTLTSADSADVLYSVRMMLGSEIYTDSLVFFIPANEEVDGQIIFANSRVSKSAKPTFTSKLKILNGK